MDQIAAILATIEKFEKYVMAKAKNILFIMFDQLRWDYLSCSGHPDLKTPNIDWLASQGVWSDACPRPCRLIDWLAPSAASDLNPAGVTVYSGER